MSSRNSRTVMVLVISLLADVLGRAPVYVGPFLSRQARWRRVFSLSVSILGRPALGRWMLSHSLEISSAISTIAQRVPSSFTRSRIDLDSGGLCHTIV